jgi:hypothetical protein
MSGLLGLAGSLMAIGPVVAAIVGGIILLGLAFVALKSDYDDWVKTGKSGLGINWPEWSAQIGNLKKDLSDLASAFGAFAKLPIVGQAIDLLVHGALQALDDKIKRITDGLKLMTDLLSGHFGGIPKDILGILAPGMAQGLDQRRGANSPNGGAFGWLHEHGFFHPQGQDAAGDIDPDAKPQAGVRASKALTDKLQQLRDSLQGLTGGAPLGAAALGTPTVSMATLTPASYTSMLPGAHAPANDHGAPPAALQSIIKFFTGVGWTAAQAAGIAANLDAESGLSTNPAGSNDHGRAYGIAQWHGDRQADFARWAGHAIQGSSLAEQLRFVQYEMNQGKRARAGSALAAAHTAAEAARAISELYEGPRGGAAEAARRGDVAENYARRYRLGGDQYAGGGATLHQKTDIAIHGVTDPHAAGREVASAQNRVNGDLVRNLKTAVV